MKDMFKRLKERIANMKITGSIKKLFSSFKEKTVIDNAQETFDSSSVIKGNISVDILDRFTTAIGKLKKKFTKKFNKKNEKGEVSTGKKVLKAVVRVACIILSIAFLAIVAYAIKDVFISCLQLVAMCLAVVISVEVILSVLSCAVGCHV